MSSRTRNIFFTSDWHIGHASVLKFDNRPFRDLKHMHSSLIKRFNSCVREQDVTYFLGDMGLCNNETLKSVIDKLNGTKVLILGNHDKKTQAMMNLGFDCVVHSCSMYIANELVTLTHCPLRGITREDTTGMHSYDEEEHWHGEKRYPQFSIKNEGQFHLHGHIHSPNDGRSKKILDRQYDVGLPANKYMPVSISTIESWIVRTKDKE